MPIRLILLMLPGINKQQKHMNIAGLQIVLGVFVGNTVRTSYWLF